MIAINPLLACPLPRIPFAPPHLPPPPPPTPDPQVIAPRGNNLHEATWADGSSHLVSMPTKFRKNVYIKRGDYLIVAPIEEGDKVRAEIVHILATPQVKWLKRQGKWPSAFGADGVDASGQEDAHEAAAATGEDDPHRLVKSGGAVKAKRKKLGRKKRVDKGGRGNSAAVLMAGRPSHHAVAARWSTRWTPWASGTAATTTTTSFSRTLTAPPTLTRATQRQSRRTRDDGRGRPPRSPW